MKARAFLRATCISASILLSTIGAYADGTITVTGTVTSETCSINFNGLGAGIMSGTVTLPSVSKSQLSTQGATSGATPFTIAVSGCTGSATTMNAYFDPSSGNVNPATGRLQNGSTGTSSGVDVQILASNGTTVINLANANGSQGSTATTLTSGAATQLYFARYYAAVVNTSIVAGTIVTTLNYSMVYV